MVHSPISKSICPASASISTLLCVLALGCAAGDPSTGPTPGPQLRGRLHGGQQPVSGASIQLFAAGTSGYGAGAVSLLTSLLFSDANGGFTFTGVRTCPSATSQLYIVATGGNPGLAPGTNNSSLAMMAALGPCKLVAGQPSLDPGTFVNIDEVTTVASVYALAGFMDPATSQIGSSSTNAAGIANAFATAANLVDISSGQARSTTPAGNGTVPQAGINTLADILAPCINSAGTGPACTTLFASATPAGGAAPTNTLQATLNIAQHPANSVTALYAQGSAFAPFQPTLLAAPTDWTLAVSYTGSSIAGPIGMAIDGFGDVWIDNQGVSPSFSANVTELSNSGVPLSGVGGYTGGGLRFASGLAIDPAENVWVLGAGDGNVVKLSNTATILSGTSGYGAPTMDGPRGIAIDGDGNAWIPNFGGIAPPSVIKLANDGTVLSGSQGFMASGTNSPFAIAIDDLQNAWIANINDRNVTELSRSGATLSPPSGFTGGLNGPPTSLAIDSSGHVWIEDTFNVSLIELSPAGAPLSPARGFPLCVPPSDQAPIFYNCQPLSSNNFAIDGSGNLWAGINYLARNIQTKVDTSYFGLVEFSNAGTILSGPSSYVGAFTNLPVSIAVDNSGNVWSVTSSNIAYELIGAATPVTTPLSVGVRDHKLGARP